MQNENLFLDTSFAVALLNPLDQLNARALTLSKQMERAAQIWVTEAILAEIGDAFSKSYRTLASAFIDQCYKITRFQVVSVDTNLFRRAKALYEARTDKTWGLTDCISFVVMQDNNLIMALTADRHFVQAGFRALLLESPSPN